MRILFAADLVRNPDSGAAGTEYQTIAALRRLGHEVDEFWTDNLPRRIYHGNLRSLLDLPYAYRTVIRTHSVSRAYDVYHVNQPHSYLAALDHRRHGRAGVFIHRSHGLESRVNKVSAYWRRAWNEPEKRFPRQLATNLLRRLLERHSRLAARYCDGTIVSSSLCKDYIMETWSVPAERVAVIHQAPPLEYNEHPVREPSALRQKRVLYVGQYAFIKGPRLVAEVYRGLAERFGDVELTWVCDPGHHDLVRTKLGPHAARCRLIPWMKQAQLRDVYDEHGIFLFPSLFEGFGKAFLEAMSRGLAVVASDEGGMHDLIENGENGLLAPVGDGGQLVEQLSRVLRDPDLYTRLARRARATALQYSWDRVGRETAEFYEHLLELRHRTTVSTH